MNQFPEKVIVTVWGVAQAPGFPVKVETEDSWDSRVRIRFGGMPAQPWIDLYDAQTQNLYDALGRYLNRGESVTLDIKALEAHASAVADRVEGLCSAQADRCIRVDRDDVLALLDEVDRLTLQNAELAKGADALMRQLADAEKRAAR